MISFFAGLDRLTANVADTESKNSFRRHDPKFLRANFFRQQLAMFLQRKSVWHFQRRPKFVFRTGSNRIGGTNDHVARKRVALRHPVERAVDFFLRNFPRHQRAVGEIRRQKSLPDATNSSRTQHRGDPRHHHIDLDIRAARNFFEGFADKPFDLVLRNREDLRVNWIVVLDRQHSD